MTEYGVIYTVDKEANMSWVAESPVGDVTSQLDTAYLSCLQLTMLQINIWLIKRVDHQGPYLHAVDFDDWYRTSCVEPDNMISRMFNVLIQSAYIASGDKGDLESGGLLNVQVIVRPPLYSTGLGH